MVRIEVTIVTEDGTRHRDYVHVDAAQFKRFEQGLEGWNPANWLVTHGLRIVGEAVGTTLVNVG